LNIKLLEENYMSSNKKALIIIDVQRDFCPGGPVAVKDGDSMVPMINRYIEGFSKGGGFIYAARKLYSESRKNFQALGADAPPHCVQGSPGAEFHRGLKLPEEAVIITRGLDSEGVCLSAFAGVDEEGRTLKDSLLAKGVSHIYLAGIATEHSVKATALEARGYGFFVTILLDGVRAVNKKTGDSEVAIGEMRKAGADTRDFSCLVLQLSRAVPKINS